MYESISGNLHFHPEIVAHPCTLDYIVIQTRKTNSETKTERLLNGAGKKEPLLCEKRKEVKSVIFNRREFR